MDRVEKQPDFAAVPVASSAHDLDQAHRYLQHYLEAGPVTEADIARVTRKVDWFIIFIASLVFEFPNIYIINKVPPAKWLAGNCVLWGAFHSSSHVRSHSGHGLACKSYPLCLENTV